MIDHIDDADYGGPEGVLDPILVPGSLLLLDMPKSWPSAGAPGNGAAFKNLAWHQLAAILGSGNESSLACSFTVGAGAEEILMEKTGKGGLHGISSLTTQEQTDHNRINLPALLRAYLFARYGLDRLYISAWTRVTRQSTAAAPDVFQIGSTTNTGSNYKARFGEDANRNQAQPGRQPVLNGVSEQLGNSIRNIQTQAGAVGTPPGSEAALEARWLWGSTASTWQNKGAGRILYRLYAENLEVSQRTYAEVDAIDYALYTAAFASGGRFYNDTFTDPSTVP